MGVDTVAAKFEFTEFLDGVLLIFVEVLFAERATFLEEGIIEFDVTVDEDVVGFGFDDFTVDDRGNDGGFHSGRVDVLEDGVGLVDELGVLIELFLERGSDVVGLERRKKIGTVERGIGNGGGRSVGRGTGRGTLNGHLDEQK